MIADSSKMGFVFLQVKQMPQVVVFLLHGAAMAGGLGMACAADQVIAVKDTRMALTETAIGIVPAQIMPHVVNRVGEFNARRIMLTGLRFTAAEGQQFGIVDFLANDMAEAEAEQPPCKPVCAVVRPVPMRQPKNCWKLISAFPVRIWWRQPVRLLPTV